MSNRRFEDKKVSDLPEADSALITDRLHAARDGADVKVGPAAINGGIVSLAFFGGVGDWDGTTGTDNKQAILDALDISRSIYIPDGNFMFSTFAALSALLAANAYGPGRLFYDNGSSVEQVGTRLRVGVSDPNGNLGSITQGGVLLGGDGPGTDGVLLQNNHPCWTTMQPTRFGSGIEVQIYTNAFVGIGVTQIATNIIDITYGSVSNANIEVGDVIGFNGKTYLIDSKPSSTQLTVTEMNGSAVSWGSSFTSTYRHAYYYADGVCDVSGTTVTRTSGDYFFNVTVYAGQKFIKINGVRYGVSSVDGVNTITLSSDAGTQSGVAFTQKMLPGSRNTSLFRVQDLVGGSEENFAIYNTLEGTVRLETQQAGGGVTRPIIISATGNSGGREVYFGTTGRVGINTRSPAGGLHSVGPNDFQIIAENSSAAQFNTASIVLRGPSALGGQAATVIQHGVQNGAGTTGYFAISNYSYGLVFRQNICIYSYEFDFWEFATRGTARLRIDRDGLFSFGGQTGAEPAIKANGAALAVRLSDDTAPGAVMQARYCISSDADVTLSADDSSAVIDNAGATASVTRTLPDAVAGVYFTVVVLEPYDVVVTCQSGATIIQSGVATGDGGSIKCSTAGSSITLYSPPSGGWVATSVTGTWTVV